MVGLVARLFYRSVWAFGCLLPLAFGYVWLQSKDRERLRHEQMEYRFVDALAALSGALKAGYSVEHALIEAGKELEVLYGISTPICQEFRLIRSKLEMNRQPEEALMEFAARTRLEDAVVFAEVFAIANRAGGDMIAVVGKTSEMIGEKLRAVQEIRTLIRARQFEQKIMNSMPLVILAYMELVSPGYLSPVYGNIGGVVIMTIGLVLYGAAYVMGKRMTEIEV